MEADIKVEEEILFAVENGIATFTLNRPEKKNAFHDDMVRYWVSKLEECRTRSDVKVIVFTANGDSFSAGGDTSRFKHKSEMTALQIREGMVHVTQSLIRKVAEIDKPVIAAVNGLAIGGGMDLALMCDVRLATASAKFAETYAKMGLLPGVGGAWLLPRLIGQSAALDLFWSGRWVDSAEAKTLGLVNHVYSDDSFRDDVHAYVTKLAEAAPLSISFIKRLVRQAPTVDLHSHLEALASHISLIRSSEDHKEAVTAAKEKRKPVFHGR